MPPKRADKTAIERNTRHRKALADAKIRYRQIKGHDDDFGKIKELLVELWAARDAKD